MDKLTKEQRDNLRCLEKHLNTAYYGGYIHSMTLSEARQLFDFYNQAFNKTEHAYTCSHCRLRVAKLLGKLYFTTDGKKGRKNRDRRSNIG